MPWTPGDATRFTKKANTPSKRRQFSHVANKVLAETGDEAHAVRAGNAAVAHNHGGRTSGHTPSKR